MMRRSGKERGFLQGPAVYGSFSDTTDQPVITPNTPQTMTFNTTDLSYGVVLGSPTSRVITTYRGVYNFQFSVQVESTVSASRLISIWPRINGADVPNTAGDITIKSNSDVLVPAWNYVFPMMAGDYFELVWSCDGNNISLSHHPEQTSPFNKPAIPSVILTVTQDNL